VKIEVVCSDASLKPVIDTILRAAQTGQIGDGKIFVGDLADVIRIRTGRDGRGRIVVSTSVSPAGRLSPPWQGASMSVNRLPPIVMEIREKLAAGRDKLPSALGRLTGDPGSVRR
jgi:hypothetical protein